MQLGRQHHLQIGGNLDWLSVVPSCAHQPSANLELWKWLVG
jgi:hypothetical protein